MTARAARAEGRHPRRNLVQLDLIILRHRIADRGSFWVMKCLLTLVALSTTYRLVYAQSSSVENPGDPRCEGGSPLLKDFLPLAMVVAVPCVAPAQWNGYAHDPQHTAVSGTAVQPLSHVRWQTPIDTNHLLQAPVHTNPAASFLFTMAPSPSRPETPCWCR